MMVKATRNLCNDWSVCSINFGRPSISWANCVSKSGLHRGDYVLNPTTEEIKNSQLDLVVAGTRDGVLMVESEASELKKKLC